MTKFKKILIWTLVIVSAIVLLLGALSEKSIYPIVLFIYLLTAPLLYWAFENPEELDLRNKKRILIIILAVIYVIFALLPDSDGKNAFYQFGFIGLPLFYSIIFRKQIRALLKPSTDKWFLIYVITFLLIWVDESILAVDHVINGNYANGIHSVITHLLGYSGFYLGIALVMMFFYRKYGFSARQTFIIGGIWGVLIEQQFLGPIMLFSGQITELIVFASFVFPVYGLVLAGPRILFNEEFNKTKNKSKRQTILLFIGIVIIPLITWFLGNSILKFLGIDLSGVI